jgi:hypothetical protein
MGERAVRYAPRMLSALPHERVRSWTVKRYAVSALRPTPPEGVLEMARRAVDRSLPEAYPHELSCGFSVVHEDEDGCYVVVGWWSRNRVILHTRTWLADWEDLTTLTPAPAGATACIWELVAIGHERDAWVRHVVVPDRPDLDTFLAATVSGRF